MSIKASQSTGQQVLTAKQHVVDIPCKKCGTFVRNFKTRSCIECDRIRHRKAYQAKKSSVPVTPKPLPVVEPLPAPKHTRAQPKPSAAAQAINSAIFAQPDPVKKGGVLVQPFTDDDRFAVSKRLAADMAAFLAKGGKVSQGAA